MKLIFTILLGIMLSFNLFAQPSTITYQGKLLDVNGIPVNQNSVAMTFAIYDAATDGIQVWPSTGTVSKSVNVVAGLYSVTLGTGSGNDDVFTATNLSGAALYLEVSVAGNPLPRNLLTTVPYAVVANQSSSVSKNNDITIQTTANNGDILLATNGTGKVIVNNELQYNVGSSLDGKVLTSDANGNASWQTGSSGSGLSSYLSNSNNTGSVIAVVLGGTDIPFPTANVAASGITANGGTTLFTVSNSGKYLISYEFRITSSALVSTRVLINGTGIASLTVAPSNSETEFNKSAIISLTAGEQISVQFFGLLGAVTLSNPGGATLNIMKIAD